MSVKNYFVQLGLCRLTIQPTSSGYWTIYMSDQDIGRMPGVMCLNKFFSFIILSLYDCYFM